ncbi:hypothetical protein [Streptomyces sp. NPDC005953]|uniref:hypothetical protein n=1 Tax=Streptomyces sp. NPDC005953 TaxID=3156719 RepID=UPI0033FEA1B0
MIIVYTPEDGEPEQYDARTLLTSEASILQRTLDMKWQEIKDGLPYDDLDAMRGIVWILKKREQSTLRFGEFDPGTETMTARWDRREITEMLTEGVRVGRASPDIDDEIIADALRGHVANAADREHAEAVLVELLAGGKDSDLPPEENRAPSETATSTSSEPSTSGSSPTSVTPLPEPSTP